MQQYNLCSTDCCCHISVSGDNGTLLYDSVCVELHDLLWLYRSIIDWQALVQLSQMNFWPGSERKDSALCWVCSLSSFPIADFSACHSSECMPSLSFLVTVVSKTCYVSLCCQAAFCIFQCQFLLDQTHFQPLVAWVSI